MTWGGIAAAAASVIVGTVSATQANKRAKKQSEEANMRQLIEGAPPNLSNVEEVVMEEIGVEENEDALRTALQQMDYDYQQGQESAEFDPQQQGLMQAVPPELEQLLLDQQSTMAAHGGPVGSPADTYYFGVPQIMSMMQDSNPQIQGVGMQLADQMSSSPGMSMIPATRDQIQGMAYGGQVEPKKYDKGGVLEPQGTLTTSGYASNTPSVTEYEDPSEVDPQIREYLELQNSLSGLGTELLNTITTADTPIEQSINTIRGVFSNWNESPDLRGTIFDSTDAARQRMLDRQELSQEERRDLYFQDMEDAEAKQGREDALRAFIEMQRDKRRATGGPVQSSRYDGGGVVDDPDPMKEVLKDLLINQIPGVSQLRALKETGKDVKEAEGLEKVVELLDLAPINPVKLGRGIKERVSARRAARRAAEEDAESRVFGPR